MRKDKARNFDYLQSIAPAAITATTTGSEVSLVGVKDNVLILVDVGAISAADSSNYVTFTVTQATASGGSFSAAASGQYDTVDSWDRILNATTEGSAVYAMNFKPAKGYDYIKVVATETGTFNGIFGAHVLVDGRHQPEST